MPLGNGHAFLMAGTGGAYNPAGAHLMVCIAIDRPNNRVVVVPITSRTDYSDESCCLYQGDHPFIRHDSIASYQYCQVLAISEVEQGLIENKLKSRTEVTDAILKKLQVGLVTSDEVTPDVYQKARGDLLAAHLKLKDVL